MSSPQSIHGASRDVPSNYTYYKLKDIWRIARKSNTGEYQQRLYHYEILKCDIKTLNLEQSAENGAINALAKILRI